MQGKTINGFVLQNRLGMGGMAEVWYAENKIGKKAAVKLLLPRYCDDDNVVSRFLTEAKVMVDLNHPNIRQVYDYGDIDGRPTIVMEYLEGEDLKERMKRGQRFTDAELVKWWNQLVDALNYTHKKGIIHRDIKPGNIFVDEQGNIKLLDFGIAKVRESISSTQTGQKIGTLLYMSPEQVKDSKHIDYHTDIYSLAVTFVHLITGKKPYDSNTVSDFDIQMNIVGRPLDLNELPVKWRAFLEPYLEKDASKRPDLRYFSENNVGTAPKYENNVDDEGTMVSEPSTPRPEDKSTKEQKSEPEHEQKYEPSVVTNKPKQKNKTGLWIGLAAAILVLGIIVLVTKKDNDTKAFESCRTASDYRAYMSDYGRNSKHYAEAKSIMDKYVADSTLKAQKAQQAKEEADAKKQAEETAKAKKQAEAKAKAEAEAKAKAEQEAKAKAEAEAKAQIVPKGTFSVSNNKRVRFSKGNLQYQASTGKWRFAEHQWDFEGKNNSNISSSYNGWIDLFGWGTSGYNGNYPYLASDTDTDYKVENKNISGTNYDWGLYNTISNGEGKKWYTLTYSEWMYIFNARKTKSGINYARANVNNINGIILLPDSWEAGIYSLYNTNDDAASYDSNRVSLDDWINKFESNGAVFLPTAGMRFGTSVNDLNSEGYYWTSTYDGLFGIGEISKNDRLADYVQIYNGSELNGGFIVYGFSVRLVTDVK